MGLKLFNRRRNYVVNPQMQRRIILSASWPLIVILGIMILVQFVLDAQLVAELQRHDLELTGHRLRIVSALLFMAFALTYVGVMSLKLSHRVAGASYRLRETLKSFRNGEREVRAKLRDGDFLTDLEDDMNSFLDWAQENVSSPAASRPAPAQRTAHSVPAGEPASPAGTGS